MNEQKFDLNAVLENSDRIGEGFAKFDARLAQAQNFEESIFSVMARLNTTIPFYKDGKYGLKVVGNPYLYTNKSLNDNFQKADTDMKVQYFHALKELIGTDGERLGVDLLSAVNKNTLRDNLKTASKDHQFIVHDSNLLGITSPTYASKDKVNYSPVAQIQAIRDSVALNAGNLLKTDVSFNPLTGSLKSRIFFDSLNVPSFGRGDIGWGVAFQTNYAGGGSTRLGIAKIDSHCWNGQMTFHSVSSITLVNSSERNIMDGQMKYFHKHSDYWSLAEEDQVIIDFVDNDKNYAKVFENPEYSARFYDLMAKTYLTAVNMEKSRHERAMIRATETDIGNIVEAYKELRAKYSKILTPTDVEKLLYIVDTDPTIDQENHTQYTLIQGITRLANDPAISEGRSQRLQALGDEILLEITA